MLVAKESASKSSHDVAAKYPGDVPRSSTPNPVNIIDKLIAKNIIIFKHIIFHFKSLNTSFLDVIFL